jgi:predicted phosphoadenosine phosphosulfate sulfurtransferase
MRYCNQTWCIGSLYEDQGWYCIWTPFDLGHRYITSVAEWLRSLTSNHLPLTVWVRIPTKTLDSFMWVSYPASIRNVSSSTQVPVRAWNNARKGTWGLPPPVKLERRDLTYTMSMWRKIQNKQTKHYFNYITSAFSRKCPSLV